MRTPLERRRDGDRGATLIEFAFVFPLLALFFTALADVGFVVLGSSVASGAARDGARVGIIKYLDSDDPTSANHDLITDAVEARLLGWVKQGTGPLVNVRCLDGDTDAVKPCTESAIEIDTDLIEVTVDWEAVAATGLFPVDRTQSDTARMVIIGEAQGGTVTPPPPGGSTFSFNPTSEAVTEGDANTSVVLTITRTNTSGTASVTVTAMPGTAAEGSDFEQPATSVVTFADTDGTEDITVTIVGDDVDEGSEEFTIELSNPIGATIAAGVATVSIADDDGATDTTPPLLQSLAMRDDDSDGLVDQVIAVFDETLGPCSSAGAWTLTDAPSGATLSSVSIAGSTATLTLTEGGGAHDTAVGAFTLGLAATGSGMCDTSGNEASFAATAPADFAGPVLIGASHTDGSVDGLIENGDTLTLAFSEPIANAPTTIDPQVTSGASGQFVAPGFLGGAVNLGDTYATHNLTYTGSSVAASGSSLVLTLAGCETSGKCFGNGAKAVEGSSPALTLSAAASLSDAAGRSASGSVVIPAGPLF